VFIRSKLLPLLPQFLSVSKVLFFNSGDSGNSGVPGKPGVGLLGWKSGVSGNLL
jgi:hypothetical protein